MSFSGKPDLTNEDPITNDGFWVDLDMSEFMTNYRLPAEYDDGVIKQGVVMAAIRVNAKLQAVKTAVNAQFMGSFEEFLTANPNYMINDLDWAIIDYKHAVFCTAKAFLLNQFNTLNRRKDAENDAKEAPQVEEYWLNQAQQSIYNLSVRYAPTQVSFANNDTFIALI